MSDFSDEMISVALDVINEFGEAGSFVRTTEGTYNPESGEAFSETTVTYTGSVVPTEYSDYEMDGTIIQKGDMKVMAAVMDEVPAPDDILTFGDFSGKIITVNRSRVNGEDIIYTLQVRV